MPRGVPNNPKPAPAPEVESTTPEVISLPEEVRFATGDTRTHVHLDNVVWHLNGEEVAAPVSGSEHDAAVNALRNEISDLKEQVDDLLRIVTAPTGAVEFSEVFRGEEGPSPLEGLVEPTPWFDSDIAAGTGEPWYQPDRG